MLTLAVKGTDFEQYLPHRGRNIIIDEVNVYGEGLERKGYASFTVTEQDPTGRDIFLQKGPDGVQTLNEFSLVEHMALTSSVMIFRDVGDGQTAFFSTITNFRRLAPSDDSAGNTVRSLVVPRKGRRMFHRSRAVILGPKDEEAIAVEIMAAILDQNAEGTGESGKFLAKPDVSAVREVDRTVFRYKTPHFLFLDEETDLSTDGRRLTARYAYPEDHPFTEGHFPGNPVMMGVTQWAGVLDGAVWLVHRLGLGAGTHTVDGDIFREDGSAVCEVKGLTFSWDGAEPGTCPRILSTKRIGFRDVVGAGDVIYLRVTLAE